MCDDNGDDDDDVDDENVSPSPNVMQDCQSESFPTH